jgi:protein MpaA
MKVNIVKYLGLLATTLLFVACTTLEHSNSEKPPQSAPVTIPSSALSSTPQEVTSQTSTPLPTPLEESDVVEKIEEKPINKISSTTITPEEFAENEEKVEEAAEITHIISNPIINLCEEIGTKLGSVSITECMSQELVHSSYSTENRSLAYKDFPPLVDRDSMGKILVIGGIHGDEFSSVSMLFRWMGILDQHHSGMFHWRFVPSSNPDGLLKRKSQRQNFNGVDLNRNFPTLDWENHALSFWEQKSFKNPRRYPGPQAGSEAETKWLVTQIQEFEPDVIISMHAPYHLVDYDGPPTAPNSLGGLYLRKLGVFPGSLGNYAGVDLKMPIVTIELQSAGIMPNRQEVDNIWRDLVLWLKGQLTPAD